MEGIAIMGYLAGTCTTLAVVPQIYKAWRTSEAENVSLKMYLVLLAGLGLWFFYGKGINDLPIMIFNGIAFLLNLFMVYLILRHGRSKKK
jgi:MtN3 and saliva related transmembrane protein